jgi:thioredoxin 1
MLKEVNLKDYEIEVPDEGKVIIDIFTKWCAPCRILSQVLENFEEQGLIKVVKIDLDENRELGQALGISSIPTLLFIKDGKLLEKNIELKGKTLVNNGIMIGASGELVLKEIIKRM